MPYSVQDRLRREGVILHQLADPLDSRLLSEAASRIGARWLVIDGYGFGVVFQRALRDHGFFFALFDDFAQLDGWCADVLIDGNLGADSGSYPDLPQSTHGLFGPRYAPIRREIKTAIPVQQDVSDELRRILVTFGGSDPGGLTALALEAITSADLRGVEVTAIIGPAAKADAGNQALRFGSRITVVRDPPEIGRIMATADLAVSAAGSTCLELAALGVPMIVTPVAPNQRTVAQELVAAGAAVNLGPSNAWKQEDLTRILHQVEGDPHVRHAMSVAGRQLVDGGGGDRVITALRKVQEAADGSVTGTQALRVRKAHADDIRLVWTWNNEPTSRAMSFDPRPIPWADHERWYAERLTDPNSLLLVAEDGGRRPVGLVRFQVHGNRAEIGITIGPDQRGQGLAAKLIVLGTERLFETRAGVRFVDAFIKPTNSASLRAFMRARYERVALTELQGQAADLLRFQQA